MVPPTPGILAVSVALAADLGMVITWGVVVAGGGLYLLDLAGAEEWCEKEWIEPVPAVVEGIEETKSADMKDILINEPDLPGTFASFLTILIPVVLIAGGSFIKMALPEGTESFMMTLASIIERQDRGSGRRRCLHHGPCLLPQEVRAQEQPGCHRNRPQGLQRGRSQQLDRPARGLEVALAALLITAMGGGFSEVIKACPAIGELTTLIDGLPIPALLIPFFAGGDNSMMTEPWAP